MNRPILPIICIALVAGSCERREMPTQSTAHREVAAQPSRSMNAIELPRYQIDLPPGPGRETFAVACLSCHSARYIGMQPPLTQAKWDEEVRKMTKTYGAPISEDQVPRIVQYLMATKESGDPGAWNTLSGTAAEVPISATIALATDPPSRDQDRRRGATLYASNCASCHGSAGAGDGPSAASLFPLPTDLRTHHYSARALTAALWNGVPGTAMPSYRALSRDDLRALATFTQSLGPAPQRPTIAPDALAQAKSLYQENCASCHGANGAGDGFAAAALARRPIDLQNIQPTSDAATKVIALGIPGTAMSQWYPKLTDAQQRLLADYVRSLFTP
jgi:mono/diheme cytochrome c family protein